MRLGLKGEFLVIASVVLAACGKSAREFTDGLGGASPSLPTSSSSTAVAMGSSSTSTASTLGNPTGAGGNGGSGAGGGEPAGAALSCDKPVFPEPSKGSCQPMT